MNYSFTCLVKYQNGHTGYLLHSDTSSCSDCSLVILTINPLSKGSFRQDAGIRWFLSGLLHWCKDRKFSISVETWVYSGKHRKTLASCLNKALATFFYFYLFLFFHYTFFLLFLVLLISFLFLLAGSDVTWPCVRTRPAKWIQRHHGRTGTSGRVRVWSNHGAL